MDTPYRDVEPGLPVRIVMGEDRWAEDIITLDSAIYEVNGASLVLAQTYPPVDDKVRGREVTVTFLGRALDEQPVRLGFPAVIVGCIERYRPATGRAVYEAGRAAGAIRAERKGAAVPFTMRASFRVEPT
ncbi:MAG: hypothetical protein ABSC19_07995, partial [Syntrophorhabdales bacterium]